VITRNTDPWSRLTANSLERMRPKQFAYDGISGSPMNGHVQWARRWS
jgi:hypothetical protein